MSVMLSIYLQRQNKAKDHNSLTPSEELGQLFLKKSVLLSESEYNTFFGLFSFVNISNAS